MVGLDDRRDGTVAVRMRRVGVDEETTVIAREYLEGLQLLLEMLTVVG